MKLNNYLVISMALVLVIGGFALLKKTTVQSSDDYFVVGTAAGYAPWVSINAAGEYEGFDIDVMNALAQKMNKKLKIKDLGSMSSLFMALDQQKIDAIIWGMSITKDRLKRVAMVRYQGDVVDGYPLLFWQRIPDTVKTIQDMQGMTVCVEPSSSQDAVLSLYPFITKLPTEKVDDALLNIQYGKAVAALVEPAIAKKFKNKYPEIQLLNVPLAPENQVYGVGVCIKKENGTLVRQVEQAAQELLRSGFIKQREAAWGIS